MTENHGELAGREQPSPDSSRSEPVGAGIPSTPSAAPSVPASEPPAPAEQQLHPGVASPGPSVGQPPAPVYGAPAELPGRPTVAPQGQHSLSAPLGSVAPGSVVPGSAALGSVAPGSVVPGSAAPGRVVPGAIRLADGEWHRLHPASPLLKGGIAFIAILGVIIVNLRDIVIDMVFGTPGGGGREPLVWVYEHGYVGLGILAIVVGLLLFIGGFYLSWRMHTFRITAEVVEVRSGILFRTNRKARLDRIQGINIVRPFFARLFGAAKLEVNQAGQDANVQLAYLGSAAAEELRREILRLASGAQGAAASVPPAARGGLIEQRVSELLGPELDPSVAPPESVVTIHLGRLFGSIVLSGFTVFVILAVTGVIITVSITKEFFFLFAIAPAIIGFGGFYISRFTRSLRYSIAGTPDGVRVGYGLFSTTNETLPPGRIHSVQVVQPLLWRPAGWWEIKVNRAAHSSAKGAAGQANTTILPVGNRAEVMRVLALLLPDLADEASLEIFAHGLDSRGTEGGFTNSPGRAAILRWFSWRRNGFAMAPGAVLLRKGAIWRSLTIVPQARMQSVGLRQGPLLRRLGLGSVQLHTVAGPIVAELGAIDRDDALRLFSDIADAAVASASADTTHRWRAGEAPA